MGGGGLPLRAAYGLRPGHIQSVDRSERHALLRGLQLLPGLRVAVSGLLGAVREGAGWSEAHASATATHADIWRH
eukprot:8996796-Pyramimonas_sp.AAC.1